MSVTQSIPRLLYGTAWKEERTRALVLQALDCGFRGIDTANQRKHYHEVGVAEGVSDFLSRRGLDRAALFLQSKFTHQDGQDHRLPYDPRADIATQVEQSFASTLSHFQTNYLDSYVLHGPSSSTVLTDEDWEAWRAMEGLATRGAARLLGISNVRAGQLEALLEGAAVRPRFVQNRCYARRGWDREVRQLCARHGIIYQGFSLLTANPEVLGSGLVRTIGARAGLGPAQVIFAFALGVGMLPLIGSSSAAHLAADLAGAEVELLPEERSALERIGGG